MFGNRFLNIAYFILFKKMFFKNETVDIIWKPVYYTYIETG